MPREDASYEYQESLWKISFGLQKKLMDCSLQMTSSSYQRKKLREIKPIQK